MWVEMCSGGPVTAPMLPRATEAELEGALTLEGRRRFENSYSEAAAALRMSEGFGAIRPGVGSSLCSRLAVWPGAALSTSLIPRLQFPHL